MELHIESYHALSALPEMCSACLYWDNPQAFRNPTDLISAMTQKRAWVKQHGGGATGGFVAYDGDTPIGFAHFTTAPIFPIFPMLQEYECGPASPDAIFIACLHIVQSAQDRGVGRRLVECVEEKAKQDGFFSVETIARISADNPSGPIAFWQKNGYVVIRSHGEFALVSKDTPARDNGRITAP